MQHIFERKQKRLPQSIYIRNDGYPQAPALGKSKKNVDRQKLKNDAMSKKELETIFLDSNKVDKEVLDYAVYKVIVRECCKVMDVTEDQLKTGSNANHVGARMYAVYLITKYAKYNTRTITKHFGTTNHSKIYRLLVRINGFKEKNKFVERHLKILQMIEDKVNMCINHRIKDLIEISPIEYPICINIPNSNRLIFVDSPNKIKIDLKSKYKIAQ